jgi:spore coat protein U-like protein
MQETGTMTRSAFLASLYMLAAVLLSREAQAQGFSCGVSPSSGSIAFGVYDPTNSTAATAQLAVTLTCDWIGPGVQQVSWDMRLSAGNSGSCAARRMNRTSAPIDTLNYNIAQGVGGANWGTTACGTFPTGSMTLNQGAGNRQRIVTRTLAGTLPINQLVSSGTYRDQLVLTIGW